MRWIFLLSACAPAVAPPPTEPVGEVLARYEGGAVRSADLEAELARLPSPMRHRAQSGPGRRDAIVALVDKKLLAAEADRLKLDTLPEVQRELNSLRERLVTKAQMDRIQAGVSVPESEAETWFNENQELFRQGTLRRIARIFVKDDEARGRALAARVQQGEPFATVARDGDGPERTAGGDLGWIKKGQLEDAAVDARAFGIEKVGDVSALFPCRQGRCLLRLTDEKLGTLPAYGEVKSEVLARLLPRYQRQAFDRHLETLRAAARVEIVAGQ
jgi:hypothetical protein